MVITYFFRQVKNFSYHVLYIYCIFLNHRLIMKCFISSYWKKNICDFKQSCSLSGGATISDLDYLSGFCARCRSLPPPYCQQLFTRFKLGSRTQLVSFHLSFSRIFEFLNDPLFLSHVLMHLSRRLSTGRSYRVCFASSWREARRKCPAEDWKSWKLQGLFL